MTEIINLDALSKEEREAFEKGVRENEEKAKMAKFKKENEGTCYRCGNGYFMIIERISDVYARCLVFGNIFGSGNNGGRPLINMHEELLNIYDVSHCKEKGYWHEKYANESLLPKCEEISRVDFIRAASKCLADTLAAYSLD